MIVVFAPFKGDKVLGKAREIADSLGSRVVAISESSGEPERAHERLIYLGADEVFECAGPEMLFDWAVILSRFLKDKSKAIKFLLGTAGPFTDAIFGRTYSLSKDNVGSFATGIDSLSGTEAVKKLRSWSSYLHFGTNPDDGKIGIYTLNSGSFPEPFEDQSRYGKVTNFSLDEPRTIQRNSPSTHQPDKNSYIDLTSSLKILIGKNEFRDEGRSNSENISRKLEEKYRAKVMEGGSGLQEVYGSCLAIDLAAIHEKELSRFHGELVALNSSDKGAITRIANTVFITDEIQKVLEELIQV